MLTSKSSSLGFDVLFIKAPWRSNSARQSPRGTEQRTEELYEVYTTQKHFLHMALHRILTLKCFSLHKNHWVFSFFFQSAITSKELCDLLFVLYIFFAL